MSGNSRMIKGHHPETSFVNARRRLPPSSSCSCVPEANENYTQMVAYLARNRIGDWRNVARIMINSSLSMDTEAQGPLWIRWLQGTSFRLIFHRASLRAVRMSLRRFIYRLHIHLHRGGA